jgi:hypothetical protein
MNELAAVAAAAEGGAEAEGFSSLMLCFWQLWMSSEDYSLQSWLYI